jgi:two-component system sensor histidine kinase PhcS
LRVFLESLRSEFLLNQALDSTPRATVARHKQRAVVWMALSSLPFWGLDVLVSPRVPWDTLAIRGIWMLLTLLSLWGLRYLPSQHRGAVGWAVTGLVMPHAFVAWILWRLGGSQSPVFAWLCVLPLLGMSLSMGALYRSLLSTAASLGMTLGLLTLEGRPAAVLGVWGLLITASGLVAVQVSYFYSRMKQARADAEAHRGEAQEALAASQARAREADRLADVGRMVAGVAHEVNNPLAFIHSNLRYLEEELARPDGSREECLAAVRETQEGVLRIKDIVQDLTAKARGEPLALPRKEISCQLPSVIEESMRLASVRLKRLAVEVEVPPEVPQVRADARRLCQVLLNLLINAADALEETGTQGARVALKVHAREERVHLVLEDNGPGISPEHLPRLFTPFFTTKAPGKGTGLGLSLSREIIQAYGGSLRVENRPEGGARFTVELLLA